MTGFDIIVLLLVGVGAINGFMRGFVQEVIALGAWIFAVFAIRYLHTPVTEFLEPHLGTTSGAAVLAFALLLLVPYTVFKAGARWAGAKSRNSVLGPIDRVIGFGFGAVKGMIIAVLAFSVLALGYDTVWGAGGRPDWITLSRTYPFVNASSEEMVTLLDERRQEAAATEAERIAEKEAQQKSARHKRAKSKH
jgi:membrane protein required for colicin V production